MPTLRLQLVDQNSRAAPVAVLEFSSTALRLQRAGEADVLAVPTPDAAAGLLAEVARALPPRISASRQALPWSVSTRGGA